MIVSPPTDGVRVSLTSAVNGQREVPADRRDWGLDWQAPLPNGSDALGYEVQLTVHIERRSAA